MPGDEVDEIGAPEIRRRLRVIAANEALQAAGVRPSETLPGIHHHPDCPMGERCWCSQTWTRFPGYPCQCHPKETK